MAFLGILGMAGLYARQVEKAGWLGLAGYLLLSLFYALTMALQFAEAFISPLLVTTAPAFVEGLLGLANGHPTEMNLGAFPTINMLNGIVGMYSAACCLASRHSVPASCRAGQALCLRARPCRPCF